ncbi:hypothetical protein MFIFM68171_02548 [Madurella fahalii]|uniref:Uncharacterized protein n=1 Tax=Madurella fahalii TaxID=1157608 RepID=A0ABQ0G3J4_9PEZI
MLFTLGFGISIAIVPQTRIYEYIICRKYYNNSLEELPPVLDIFSRDGQSAFQHQSYRQPDQSRCKVPAIQNAINELFGWQTFFDGIPGLLLAMYYGSLADRIGRRLVLIMSLVGQVIGVAYILYICWVEVDMRLTWFSSIFSCIGGGNTVFTAAGMMIIADAVAVAHLFLCEHVCNCRRDAGAAAQRLAIWRCLLPRTLLSTFRASRCRYLFATSRFDSVFLLPSYLISFRATEHLITLAILLPLFDILLAKRYKASPPQKDLTLTRLSIVVITIGYAILVLSSGMVGILNGIGVWTLGTGFQASIKSLLSSMVDKAMVGTVFTTLSLIDTVGALLAGPIDALVMKQALSMEGV